MNEPETFNSQRAPEGFLPVKPPVMQILIALAEGDLHGYGVIQRVRQGSGERIRLQTGPFYRYLRKMIENGLVAETTERPPDDNSKRGAYYRITDLGRSVVAAEAARLAAILSTTEALGLKAKAEG